MKPKEVVQLVVAIFIFAIAGFLIYGQLAPKSAKSSQGGKGVKVEKVTKIPSDFNQDSLQILGDSSRVHDFYNQPDLRNGVGNPQPFGNK